MNQKAEVKYPVTVKFDRVNFSILYGIATRAFATRAPSTKMNQ